MAVDNIRQLLGGHGMVRSIDQVPRGHIRIETAFLYPDGASVDVFALDEAPLLPQIRLSDLGQTSDWLLGVQVKPWLSKKRQAYLEDAIRIYDVSQQGGKLELNIPSLDEIANGLVRLGQACVRVSDLAFTRRSSLVSAFSEDVEEVLADSELEYQTNIELKGRYNQMVRVDFFVQGSRTSSALLTMSSGNTSSAHVQANEIFRRWYDFNIPERTEQRVTVFDDRYDVYRDDDLRRLRDLSDVVPLSDRRTIIDLLAA